MTDGYYISKEALFKCELTSLWENQSHLTMNITVKTFIKTDV